MKIYVGNLSWDTVEDTLFEQFSAFGDILSVTIIRERGTGRSRGFGFVEMATDAALQAAIEEMNGVVVDGRSLKVTVAHQREERHSYRLRQSGGRSNLK